MRRPTPSKFLFPEGFSLLSRWNSLGFDLQRCDDAKVRQEHGLGAVYCLHGIKGKPRPGDTGVFPASKMMVCGVLRGLLMSDLPYPSWQEAVRVALMEFGPDKLEAKIFAAHQAIHARRTELQNSTDHHEECIALEDAANALQVVKQNLPGT